MAGPVVRDIAKCRREDRVIIITFVGLASVAKCVEVMVLFRNAIQSEGLELLCSLGFEDVMTIRSISILALPAMPVSVCRRTLITYTFRD
mmetsp:Transcript_72234/g.139625  ORF Transcript_72234/g.139625 Transcript_72234/m.139625 type:complete len:90 (+) Transcript_72234:1031-1300(+)